MLIKWQIRLIENSQDNKNLVSLWMKYKCNHLIISWHMIKKFDNLRCH